MLPKDVLEKLAYHRREVDRIFTEYLAPKLGPETVPLAVDVYETDKTLIVEVELPGVSLGEVEVSVMGDLILIEGQREARGRAEAPGARYHHAERAFGRFQRIIEIPSAVDTRQMRPVLERGVLKIEMPKVTDRRGRWRRIEVVEERS